MPRRTTHPSRLGKSDGLLATVLASGAMARLVTHFVLHPAADLHFQALRRVTGLSTRSLQRELARLEALALVTREPDGRVVRYRAVADQPRWNALRAAVRAFADPAEVLRVALAQVPGIQAAFVYGSFARDRDVHPASDVDLFIVGEQLDQEPARLQLAAEVLEASGALGRDVNASRYTWEELDQKATGGSRFVREVLAGPKSWIVGDQSALSAGIRSRRTRRAPSRVR